MTTQYKYTANIPYIGFQAFCRIQINDEFIVTRMCSDGTVMIKTIKDTFSIPPTFLQFCSRVTEDI